MKHLVPREPSIAGIMFTGFAGAAAITSPNLFTLLVAAAITYVHAVSVSEGLLALRKHSATRLTAIIAFNTIPYLALLLIAPPPVEVWAVAAAALALTAATIVAGAQSATAYITGSAVTGILSTLPLLWLTHQTQQLILYLYVYTVYVVTTSLYIESFMPHRRVKPTKALLLWVTSFTPVLAVNPYLALAAIEPTLKLVKTVYKGVEKPRNHASLKRIGVVEVARLIAFTAIVVAVIKFTSISSLSP